MVQNKTHQTRIFSPLEIVLHQKRHVFTVTMLENTLVRKLGQHIHRSIAVLLKNKRKQEKQYLHSDISFSHS